MSVLLHRNSVNPLMPIIISTTSDISLMMSLLAMSLGGWDWGGGWRVKKALAMSGLPMERFWLALGGPFLSSLYE